MVHSVIAALLTLSTQQLDTTTYKDRATADLVARAQARHAVQDTLVHDYTALVRTRLDAGFGKRRFAVIPPIVAMETVARLTWARPNDLKVEVLGARSASAIRGMRASGTFDDPWFIPRGLGDSIRFMDDEIPETGAIHPLSASGPDFYRYEIVDSLVITLPQRQVRAVGIRVEPKRKAPSLVAGNIWLDGETFEVVRMAVVFVGEYLWASPDSSTSQDSAKARDDSKWANRVVRVEAELEYALHQDRYWMPYRQLVTLTVDIPWFISARIPVRFLSTFSEYQINTGTLPRFTISPDDSTQRWPRCLKQRPVDSTCVAQAPERRDRATKGFTRAERWERGGRWEISSPPRDSLAAYAWPDQLTLAPDQASEDMIRETSKTLANLERDLPADLVGRQLLSPAWDRFSDLWRFNRVQGASVGAGFRVQPGAFVSLIGAGRFGFSDHRATGSLTLRRDAPGGRFEVGAWREVREVEPWTSGLGIGNSFNALFAGHDDADYDLVSGGGISFAANHGTLRDLEMSVGAERQRSMAATTGSRLNDWLGGSGVFQANPPVLPGDFLRAGLLRPWRLGPSTLTVGGDALVGQDAKGVRAWAWARVPFFVLGRAGALTLRTSGAAGDTIPQLRPRAGGPQTVRGYDYGARTGAGVWSGQLDIGLSKRSMVSPVVFADIGNVLGRGSPTRPLIGVGGGISFLNGIVRLNLAKGLQPRARLRFDLLFRAPR